MELLIVCTKEKLYIVETRIVASFLDSKEESQLEVDIKFLNEVIEHSRQTNEVVSEKFGMVFIGIEGEFHEIS